VRAGGARDLDRREAAFLVQQERLALRERERRQGRREPRAGLRGFEHPFRFGLGTGCRFQRLAIVVAIVERNDGEPARAPITRIQISCASSSASPAPFTERSTKR
jgi:hypothetical protein